MGTIVVGVDGSKGSLAAAQWATAQAKATDAKVLVLYAVPRSELWSLSAVQVNVDKVLAEFTELLEGRWTASLRKAGVDYSAQVVRGEPATELLRVAKRTNADMIVLGTKSHGALADLVVGGTVHKIINRTGFPVVLIPTAPPAKKSAAKKR